MASTVYTVSTAAELKTALQSVQGGDTIVLAEGNYGGLSLSTYSGFDVTFDTPVTIRSADPDAPAVFTALNLNGASNVVIEGVVFDYTYTAGDDSEVRPFQVKNSSDIVIRDSVFDGDLAQGVSEAADGYGSGQGLYVVNSTGVTIEDNEFFDWKRGAVFDNSDDLTITGNDIHGIRSDGMDFVRVNDVLIEGNYLHDFAGSPTSGDHRDMIQFWTTGTTEPSTNITIRGNTLDIGEGSYTQSIFMRNEMVDSGQAGAEMYYQNVLIEDNVIYNAHLHGITVGETDGLTIRNNSVIRVASETESETQSTTGLYTPVINVKAASTDVVIEQNVTGAINIGGSADTSDWVLKNNAYIQDSNPDKPGYYTDVFVTSSMTDEDGVHSYVAVPGGMIETLGAGAEATQFDDAPDDLTAMFETSGQHDGDRTVSFDAALTLGAEGVLVQDNATFLWDFGDGTTAKGLAVEHSYATGGTYEVTLKVVAADGSVSIAQEDVAIAGADLLSFDQATGRFLSHSAGETTVLSTDTDALVSLKTGKAVDLGGTGVQLKLPKSSLSGFGGTDDFELSMRLKADSASTGYGEVLRIHPSLVTSITKSGDVYVYITNADGTIFRLTSSGVAVNDGKVHDIVLDYNGDAKTLEISIDGQTAAVGTVEGELGSASSGLEFGNAWGKKNFEGKLLDFDLKVHTDDYPSSASAETVVLKDDHGATDSTDDATSSPTDTTAPETTPTETTTDDPAESGRDSGSASSHLEGGYQLDLAALAVTPGKALVDDARIVTSGDVATLVLDGNKDYLNIGRLTEFEQSDRIAFSIDFARDSVDDDAARLVWNHLKVGLTLKGEGLLVQVATADGDFQSFAIKDLGLDDTDLHNAVVMIDETSDHLQVFVDDQLVLDETETDFQFSGAGGREWGWSIGTAWGRYFDGEVTDFQVTDSFDFVDDATLVTGSGLMS